MNRIANSWRLVQVSVEVLRADKELILFPIVSMVGAIAVMATFAVPMLLAGFFDSLASGRADGLFSVVIGFLFYVVMYFITIFSHAALIGAATIRLRGSDPTVRDGFSIALKHAANILGYALIAATVGMVLRAISERGGIVGQIVSSILGFAWGVVTFLVVPVLVIEEIGPIEAVKRSGQLLKDTWGEQLVGNFGIGVVFGLLALGIIVLVGLPLIALAVAAESVLFLAMAIAVTVVLLVGAGLIGSTLNGIYQAAVYHYAVEGTTGGYFPADLIQGAFRQK